MMPRKRLKVVLYNPWAVFYTMPLALLAVGSELDPEIYEVVIIDARVDSDAESMVLSHIDGAVCFGVTVLTGAPISDALRISRAVKRAQPKLTVVWGGWHPSMFSRECLLESSVDVTVRGQGEETFAEIVGRLAEGRSLEDCEGCTVRLGDGTIRENPARSLAASRQVPGARLFTHSGRTLLSAQRQTAARLYFLSGLQFPLRVLLRPIRLWTKMGRARAHTHGDALERALGSLPI